MPVVVTGLDQLARELKSIDPAMGKALQKGHKEISTELAQKSQAAVSGLPDAGGRGAKGIRPRATAKKATIALLGSNPFTFASVFGTELHWVFGRPIPASAMSRRAWQPWIGNDWTPEEGLYGISPVISREIPNILETYGDRVMDALAGAFPKGLEMVSWDKPGRHSEKQPESEPVFARVALSELTLAEARSVVDDAAYFDETRMPILFWFHVPVNEYEELTVGTHAEMVAYLKLRGVIDGDV